MKLVIINGPSCVGKSTIIRELLKMKENVFLLSFDSLKRNFSQYEPIKDYVKVRDLLESIAQYVFLKKFDVITDSVLRSEGREKLINLAKKQDYEVVEINLEADKEVLQKRFQERIERSADAFVKPTNTSIDRWEELFDLYHNEKNKEALTFFTDKMTEKEIIEKVAFFL